MAQTSRPSSDLAKFRELFSEAQRVVILTGAGVSAESGVPTFRGAGGFWRTYQAQDLATPEAFDEDPSLVWEFYHYRREVMLSKKPNPAHLAIAECAERLEAEGRRVRVITQNIDELHRRAGTKDLLELHGSLFKVRCLGCGQVTENRSSPICEALRDKGAPDTQARAARIPHKDLPRCQAADCGGLLRPHVVWFGEQLDRQVLSTAEKELGECDLCLVVGTSSVVYPAAMFAPEVARRGVPVAEFNMETTPATQRLGGQGFFFQGPCGTTLPPALAMEEADKVKPFAFGVASKEEKKPLSFGIKQSDTDLKPFGVVSVTSNFGSSAETSVFSYDFASMGGEEEEALEVEKVKPVAEEGSLYSKKCKLFYKKKAAYRELGLATVHLKLTHNRKVQVVVRAETSLGNILLNVLVSEGVSVERVGKNNVMLIWLLNPPIDPKAEPEPATFLLRLKTGQEADELKQKLLGLGKERERQD